MKFYSHKSPIFLKDLDIEKLLVSSKISCGKKNYKHFTVTCIMIIKLIHIMLPKISSYVKSYDTHNK